MASESFPVEQIHDPHFEQLVGCLCQRTGMYVDPASYGAVCAYLDGFNYARNGGPLIGLERWLVVRANGGNNLHWSALARSLLPSGKDSVDEQAIRELGGLLSEFFEYRRTQGITKVFHEYARWLLRRSWYNGPLRRKPGGDS
jgi:hypothetical protein